LAWRNSSKGRVAIRGAISSEATATRLIIKVLQSLKTARLEALTKEVLEEKASAFFNIGLFGASNKLKFLFASIWSWWWYFRKCKNDALPIIGQCFKDYISSSRSVKDRMDVKIEEYYNSSRPMEILSQVFAEEFDANPLYREKFRAKMDEAVRKFINTGVITKIQFEKAFEEIAQLKNEVGGLKNECKRLAKTPAFKPRMSRRARLLIALLAFVQLLTLIHQYQQSEAEGFFNFAKYLLKLFFALF
jgi:hypothetical protein